jgi:hypothetical protein
LSDWYVSSATYASVPTWVGSHVYSIGDLVKPTAPASAREYVFRVTTAGTSTTEPAWPVGNNATVTAGATFTNVSGQSAYGWSAAAGSLGCMSASLSGGRTANGDRIFLSSDHSEATSTALINFGTSALALVQIISVNRAGSVPPVAADILPGAAVGTTNASFSLNCVTNVYYEGITFSGATGASAGHIQLGDSSGKLMYFKNCGFVLLSTAATSRIQCGGPATLTWDNCTVKFGATGQNICSTNFNGSLILTWLNTVSAVQGPTFPTVLFTDGATITTLAATCRGIDLSALTGNLLNSTSGCGQSNILLDSCRIASGLTRLGSTSTNAADTVELVNCYDGTNVINERSTFAGLLTTDRTTYLTGGAQDDIGNYSLKLVSNANADKRVFLLDCFAFDVENTVVGLSKTATVEIVSSGSLNNDDIQLVLEYMGTSGNSIASFVSSVPSVLTAASALPSSSASWTSPPATPQKQYLQVTFTPQRAGRVRGLVRLGKVSTTCWVNPQISIT